MRAGDRQQVGDLPPVGQRRHQPRGRARVAVETDQEPAVDARPGRTPVEGQQASCRAARCPGSRRLASSCRRIAKRAGRRRRRGGAGDDRAPALACERRTVCGAEVQLPSAISAALATPSQRRAASHVVRERARRHFGGRIGLLRLDAPIAQFVERDRRAGHRAQHMVARRRARGTRSSYSGAWPGGRCWTSAWRRHPTSKFGWAGASIFGRARGSTCASTAPSRKVERRPRPAARAPQRRYRRPCRTRGPSPAHSRGRAARSGCRLSSSRPALSAGPSRGRQRAVEHRRTQHRRDPVQLRARARIAAPLQPAPEPRRSGRRASGAAAPAARRGAAAPGPARRAARARGRDSAERSARCRSPNPASVASSSARTGTAISAAAVGVGARRSAAKSHRLVSVSCPTAEMIGIEHAATARTTASSLNAHRSSIDPPPRATMTRSGARLPPASRRTRAPPPRSPPPRPSPCTFTGQTSTWLGQRSARRWRISRITAPVGDVTTPMVRGRNGSGCLARGVEQPLGGQARLQPLEQRHQRAFAGQFEPVDDDLIFRPPRIGGQLAGRDHVQPVLGCERDQRRLPLPDHAVDHRALVLEAEIDVARRRRACSRRFRRAAGRGRIRPRPCASVCRPVR